jgi:hypothetical protein
MMGMPNDNSPSALQPLCDQMMSGRSLLRMSLTFNAMDGRVSCMTW